MLFHKTLTWARTAVLSTAKMLYGIFPVLGRPRQKRRVFWGDLRKIVEQSIKGLMGVFPSARCQL